MFRRSIQNMFLSAYTPVQHVAEPQLRNLHESEDHLTLTSALQRSAPEYFLEEIIEKHVLQDACGRIAPLMPPGSQIENYRPLRNLPRPGRMAVT